MRKTNYEHSNNPSFRLQRPRAKPALLTWPPYSHKCRVKLRPNQHIHTCRLYQSVSAIPTHILVQTTSTRENMVAMILQLTTTIGLGTRRRRLVTPVELAHRTRTTRTLRPLFVSSGRKISALRGTTEIGRA